MCFLYIKDFLCRGTIAVFIIDATCTYTVVIALKHLGVSSDYDLHTQ